MSGKRPDLDYSARRVYVLESTNNYVPKSKAERQQRHRQSKIAQRKARAALLKHEPLPSRAELRCAAGFPSWEQATAAARERGGEPYRCDKCDRWHLRGAA